MVDSSCPTENGHRRTDAAREVHESEAKANPSAESSEGDRDSTVTACPGNNAIRNQTHEAGKDREKGTLRLLSGLSTKQPEIKKAVEMLAKPNAAEVKETSRAKSIWQGRDSVEQHPSVQNKSRRTGSTEAEAHKRSTSMSPVVSTKTAKTKEAKDVSKSEAELVDVMDTLQT